MSGSNKVPNRTWLINIAEAVLINQVRFRTCDCYIRGYPLWYINHTCGLFLLLIDDPRRVDPRVLGRFALCGRDHAI